MFRVCRSLRSFLIAVLAISVVGVQLASQPGVVSIALASDPCAAAQGAPPYDDPDPAIGGVVTDVDGNAGVYGATVRLYVCVSGAGVLDDSMSTGINGVYEFNVDPQEHYYVEVLLTGPLAGYVATSGTENPSELLAVGPSFSDVDFAFEED